MDFGSAGLNRSSNGTPNRVRGRNFRDRNTLHKRHILDGSSDEGKYPAALQLYPVPPVKDISLESFEDLAVQRLRVREIVFKISLIINAILLINLS